MFEDIGWLILFTCYPAHRWRKWEFSVKWNFSQCMICVPLWFWGYTPCEISIFKFLVPNNIYWYHLYPRTYIGLSSHGPLFFYWWWLRSSIEDKLLLYWHVTIHLWVMYVWMWHVQGSVCLLQQFLIGGLVIYFLCFTSMLWSVFPWSYWPLICVYSMKMCGN